MKNILKRGLPMVLALIMMVGLLPVTAFAAVDSSGRPKDVNNSLILSIYTGTGFPGEPAVYGTGNYMNINSSFAVRKGATFASSAKDQLDWDKIDRDIVQGSSSGSTSVWGVYDANGTKNYFLSSASIIQPENEAKIIRAIKTNMETGALAWTSTLTNVSSRGMATDGTLVFYVSNSGRQITAFNATTKQIEWQKDLRYNSRDGDLQEMQIDSGLVYQNGVIFHVAERGRITALDASNGNILWRIDAAGFPERVFWSTPEVDGNVIIANGIDGKVYAVEFPVT